MEKLEGTLGLALVEVTEKAALAAGKWLGLGERKAGDKAAVDAMRQGFGRTSIDGTVVIGEGEKDHAPMLFNGEKVGRGEGPAVDIAVDPVEGTNLLACGQPNAIAVVGAAPRGAMYDFGPSYYMEKIVVPGAARGVVEMDAPVGDNLSRIASALGKKVAELTVFVLDKPRHQSLIGKIRKAGAAVQLHTDGDVAGALMAVDPEFRVDVMMGTGGTPEGVISACAIKAVGGELYGRLDPQMPEERRALEAHGADLKQVLTADTMVKGKNLFFAATGISGGTFLEGVRYLGQGAVTHSLLLEGETGSIRYLTTRHKSLKTP